MRSKQEQEQELPTSKGGKGDLLFFGPTIVHFKGWATKQTKVEAINWEVPWNQHETDCNIEFKGCTRVLDFGLNSSLEYFGLDSSLSYFGQDYSGLDTSLDNWPWQLAHNMFGNSSYGHRKGVLDIAYLWLVIGITNQR